MHNLESVLENVSQKILWDFEIERDHLMSARQPDQWLVNKKEKRPCWIVDFAVLAVTG